MEIVPVDRLYLLSTANSRDMSTSAGITGSPKN